MYKVNLDVFQGPLDLLLHLIEKMEIDIHNIPIAKLTDSYLEYIYDIDEISLESAEEYIVMASTLIHIKSKKLLPSKFEDDNLEIEEELIQQLIDYKNYKEACDLFRELQYERYKYGEKNTEEIIVDPKLMNIPVEKLKKAFQNILNIQKNEENNIILKKEISLENIKISIINHISRYKKVKFRNLFDDYSSKDEIIAIFICLLDMIKNNLVYCEEIGDELYINDLD